MIVGSLVVPLLLRDERYRKGLKRAGRATRGFSRDVGRSLTKVNAFGAGLLAVAAGAGLTALVTQSFKSADALAKTSDRLGIATEELAALHHAGQLAGVGVSTLEMALQRSTRRIAEAAAGSGEAKAAIKELGLNAEELGRMSPDQQMRVLADAFQNVESSGDRVRLAMRLFDSEGVALVNMLQNGSAGLDAARAEADKLGLSLSRIDAAKVEAANDSFSRARAMFKGAAQTLAVELAPFVEHTMNKLVEFGTSGEGVAAKVVNGFEWVAMSVAKVADLFQLGKAIFKVMQAAVSSGIGLMLGQWAYLGQGIESVINLLPGVEVAFTDTLSEMSKGVLDLAETQLNEGLDAYEKFEKGAAQQSVTESFNSIRAAAHEAAEAIGEAADARNSAQDTSILNAQELKSLTEQQLDLEREAQRVFEATRTPLERYESELEKLNDLLAAGAINQDTFDRAIAKAADSLDGATIDSPEPVQAERRGIVAAVDTALGSFRLAQPRTQERQLDELEKVVKNTQDLVRIVKRGGSGFAEVFT